MDGRTIYQDCCGAHLSVRIGSSSRQSAEVVLSREIRDLSSHTICKGMRHAQMRLESFMFGLDEMIRHDGAVVERSDEMVQRKNVSPELTGS